MVARDPFALVLLAFAGAVSVPAWTFGLGIDLFTATQLPVRTGTWFAGPLDWASPTVPLRMTLARLAPVLVMFQLAWVLLVASAVQGRFSIRSSGGAPVMPALPVGFRMRHGVEALIALAVVAVARAAALFIGGESFGCRLLHACRWTGDLTYPVAVALSTLLGVLYSFPMVVGWTAVARVDVRGLLKPFLATTLVVMASAFGLMAHAASALLVCILASALVLLRLDDGSRPQPRASRAPLASLHRPSPGPGAQFRRDAWLGPLRSLWRFGLLVVVLPLAIELSFAAGLPRLPMSGALPFFQLLALFALPFFPLGLRLVPPSGSQPFSGYFLRAWSVLPVRPERVARAVYLHALGSAAVVWLVLWAQVALHGSRGLELLQVFEVPVIVLAGAIVLCEAVGDRTRGLLAVACLVGTHFVPTAHLIVGTLLPTAAMRWEPWRSTPYTLLAYGLGLLGGLPPLVHLRRRAPPAAAAAA